MPSSVAGSSDPVVRPRTALSSSGSSSSISRGASEPPSSSGTTPSSAVPAHSPFSLGLRVVGCGPAALLARIVHVTVYPRPVAQRLRLHPAAVSGILLGMATMFATGLLVSV